MSEAFVSEVSIISNPIISSLRVLYLLHNMKNHKLHKKCAKYLELRNEITYSFIQREIELVIFDLWPFISIET